MMKKICVLIMLLGLALPYVSHAVDQRCWYEQDCVATRQSLFGHTPAEAQEGFIPATDNKTAEQLCGSKEDAAGNKLGLCLPANKAKTTISIDGINEFSGFGEFIAFVYKYGVRLAGVFAVIMVIVAGAQWVVSGGNSESISAAKHKITGAVIGLILLALSYTILYTINPNLVNLRPPNVWMINTLNLPTNPYCSALKPTDTISQTPSNETGKPLTEAEQKTKFAAVASWVKPTDSTNSTAPTAPPALCGQDYFVQGTGALTCKGDFCPKNANGRNQVCSDRDRDGKKECAEASIAGRIYNSEPSAALFTELGGLVRMVAGEGWTWIWVEDFDVYVVCVNGEHTTLDVESNDPEDFITGAPKYEQDYWISISDSELDDAEAYCSNENSEVKGIVLGPDMNESGDITGARERHFVGRYPKDGLTPNTSHKMGADLGDTSNSNDECLLRAAPVEYFIPISELKSSGVLLDINASVIFDIDDDDDRKKFYDGPYKYSQNCN